MSAIRLRTTSKGLEVRVCDESPMDPEPIMVQVHNGHMAPPTFLSLTIAEATELRDALTLAITDATEWLAMEPR